MDGLLKKNRSNSRRGFYGKKQEETNHERNQSLHSTVYASEDNRGMSISEIKGFGKEKDEAYPHHSRDYVTEFTPKIRIEIACLDEEADQIVKCIKENAYTGRKGDGKILVTTLDHVVSIRTGKTDKEAL